MVKRGDKVEWKGVEGKVGSVTKKKNSDEIAFVEVKVDGDDCIYCHDLENLKKIE